MKLNTVEGFYLLKREIESGFFINLNAREAFVGLPALTTLYIRRRIINHVV